MLPGREWAADERSTGTGSAPMRKRPRDFPPGPRASLHVLCSADQNVMLQRLSVPVSAPALSDTRRRQVPFFGSPDRSTV